MSSQASEKLAKTRLWQIVGFTAFVKATIILLAPLFAGSAWFTDIAGDVWMWVEFWDKVHQGGIPYVDFSREYPVGAGMLYWLMGSTVNLSGETGGAVLLTHAIFMAVADIINAALLYQILRDIAPKRATALTVLFVLTPTALLFGPVRFEGYVTISVLAGFWCHRRGKPLWATLLWSVGTWLKWFPALFIAAQEIAVLARRRNHFQWLRSSGIFIGVALAFNLPFMYLDFRDHHNLTHWWMTYAFHIHRAISLDTVVGIVTLWIGHFPYVKFSSIWTLALMAAALIVRPKLTVEYKGVLVCIAAWVVNRVYSPQFNLWFYPFLIIVLAEETGRRLRWLLGTFILLDLTNVFVYPFSYAHAMAAVNDSQNPAVWRRGGGWMDAFSAAIMLRALSLLLLGGLLLRAKPARDPSAVREFPDADSHPERGKPHPAILSKS